MRDSCRLVPGGWSRPPVARGSVHGVLKKERVFADFRCVLLQIKLVGRFARKDACLFLGLPRRRGVWQTRACPESAGQKSEARETVLYPISRLARRRRG